MTNIHVNPAQLQYLQDTLPDQLQIVTQYPGNMGTVLQVTPRAKYAAELFEYLRYEITTITAITTDGTGDKLRAVMQAPVKGYFSSGREKERFKRYAAAELAKVTELQRKSKEVLKLIPKLAKLATEHTITPGTFEAIYGPIPCQYHHISGPGFTYKFVTI